MEKGRKEKILSAIADVNKKEGKGTIITLDKEGEKGLQIPRIPTGIEALDNVLGGGLPVGRPIEIAGEEGAGKTTIAHYLTSLFEMAMVHPVEGTFSWDRAKLFGNHAGQLYVHQTNTGESYMNKVLKMAELGIPIQVIDSVPWLKSKAEVDKRRKAANNNTIQVEKMGGASQVLNPYIEAIGTTCELTGTIIIWVNQVREKMNAMPFGDKWYTPGGKMYHHAMTIELRVARKEWIKIENYDPRNSATKETIGIIIKVKCKKNKVSPPEKECELVYLYDRGFISHAELPDAKKEIQAQRKAFFKDKSNWKDIETDEDWGDSDIDDWDEVD